MKDLKTLSFKELTDLHYEYVNKLQNGSINFKESDYSIKIQNEIKKRLKEKYK